MPDIEIVTSRMKEASRIVLYLIPEYYDILKPLIYKLIYNGKQVIDITNLRPDDQSEVIENLDSSDLVLMVFPEDDYAFVQLKFKELGLDVFKKIEQCAAPIALFSLLNYDYTSFQYKVKLNYFKDYYHCKILFVLIVQYMLLLY